MDITIEATPKDYKYYSPFYKKRLEDERRSLEKSVARTENRINEVTDTYIFQTLDERLKRYKDMLLKINDKLLDNLDEENEAFREYVMKQLYYKQKQMINSQKKKDSVQAKIKKDQAFKQEMSHKFRSERKDEYHLKKNLKYYYDRMMNTELPPYMKDNLKRMTNDKGYIYRGIWFFGEKIVKNNVLTMFENIKGIQYIHEYYWDEYKGKKIYRLYEKLSKNAVAELIDEKISNIKK
jgi:hypothetical protein